MLQGLLKQIIAKKLEHSQELTSTFKLLNIDNSKDLVFVF